MTDRLLRCIGLSFLALCFVWLAACGTAPGDRAGVQFHAWRALVQNPMQPWVGPRTQLYTYVLVGDIGMTAGVMPDSADASHSRAYKALVQLLAEVQEYQSLPSGGDPRWTPEMLAGANQFCIPAADATLKKITPADYDLALAAAYLRQFAFALESHDEMSAHLRGVGPFLLATRKPVGEIVTRDAQGSLRVDTSTPILLVDMSGSHEASVPVYVNAFKKAVRNGVAGTAVLRPLRAEFASILIDLGRAVPFVAEAYAGTKKKFE